MEQNQNGQTGYYEFMPWEEIEQEHSFRWEECEEGMSTFDSSVTVWDIEIGFDTNGATTGAFTDSYHEDCESPVRWSLMGVLRKLLKVIW